MKKEKTQECISDGLSFDDHNCQVHKQMRDLFTMVRGGKRPQTNTVVLVLVYEEVFTPYLK